MTRAARISALVAFIFLCSTAARADQATTSIGVTLNGTTGDHVEPDQSQSVPFVPLPMIQIETSYKFLRLHLEGVPPIGPVPLAQGAFPDTTADPRVTFLNGELLFASPYAPIAFGLGETILNQRTIYPGNPVVQSSRVVGLRLAARATLYNDGPRRLELNLAANPALQGLQSNNAAAGIHFDTPLIPQIAEHGSLVDTSLKWTQDEGRYSLSYGVRYLNYTAAYFFDNSLADRNHLFMPFVGVDWYARKTKALVPAPATHDDPPPFVPSPQTQSWTSGEVTLFGTNGNRSQTGEFTDVPLNFVLAPQVSLEHHFGSYELLGQAFLPNGSSNPFGAQQEEWSLLTVDALARLERSPFSLGLGETVGNIAPLETHPFTTASTRSEAVDLVGKATFGERFGGHFEALLRLNPDVHVTEYDSFNSPQHSFSRYTYFRGARVDTSLARVSDATKYGFTYGLRYVNQTTNYGPFGRNGVMFARSSSLMPFVGVSVRP